MTSNIEQTEFRPFLWAKVERASPSPIFAVAYTGIRRWLFTELPEGICDHELESQFNIVQQVISKRYKEQPKSPFGRTLGYFFIRLPDDVYEFNKEGENLGLYSGRIPHLTSIIKMEIQ
jgi:hypothetical protein